jgi:hypothetical protein
VTAPARFTQADLTRAFKAAEAAGVVARIEIEPDGKIVIVPMAAAANDSPPNPWDKAVG